MNWLIEKIRKLGGGGGKRGRRRGRERRGGKEKEEEKGREGAGVFFLQLRHQSINRNMDLNRSKQHLFFILVLLTDMRCKKGLSKLGLFCSRLAKTGNLR